MPPDPSHRGQGAWGESSLQRVQGSALADPARQASMGLRNFRKRLRKDCPWLRFGYFNPYLET